MKKKLMAGLVSSDFYWFSWDGLVLLVHTPIHWDDYQR